VKAQSGEFSVNSEASSSIEVFKSTELIDVIVFAGDAELYFGTAIRRGAVKYEKPTLGFQLRTIRIGGVASSDRQACQDR